MITRINMHEVINIDNNYSLMLNQFYSTFKKFIELQQLVNYIMKLLSISSL